MQAQQQEGFVTAMLRIATDSETQVAEFVRLAAAVQVKNIIKQHWKIHESMKGKTTEFLIPNSDKDYLRANIFLLMIKCGIKSVYSQLQECLELIADHEFPEGWPFILGQIKDTLQTVGDPKSLHASLIATYCLTKVYKYEFGSKRKNLELIIGELYTSLYQIAGKLTLNPNEQTACLLKLIAKCFATSINMDISPLLTNPTVIMGWIEVLKTAFSWTVNPTFETLTEDEEEIKIRKKSEVLKMKKAISHIFYRIFQKYGNPKFAQKELKEFSKFVQDNLAQGLLTINIQILQDSKQKFVHPHTLSLAFRYIAETVKHPKFNSMIKQSLTDLLQNCAFPLLQISPSNAQLWDLDPREFSRLLFEEDENCDYDPRYAALTLIDTACSEELYLDSKEGSYHPILAEFLGFLGTTLDKSIKENKPRAFDAAQYAIGKLEEEIEKYDILIEHVEPMIKQHVLPNLDNPIGIVRMRCCWIYSQFAAVAFKDQANLLLAFQKKVKRLKDKDLPVRVMAALAVSRLVNKEDIAEQIKPYVTEIISTYLMLMSQIELEDLVSALDSVIKTFDDSIKPYSVDLIKELLSAYERMHQTSASQEKKDFTPESGMAAAACIDTIARIVQIIGENQIMLQQVEPMLIPIILRSFTPDELLIMDSTVDILAELTYFSKKFSPILWEFYPLLVEMIV